MKINPKGSAILSSEYGQVWACLPEFFADLSQRAADGLPDVKPQAAVRRTTKGRAKNPTMVLLIHGLITQRENPFGVSTDWLSREIERAAVSNIARIVLDIDSPGGTTPGVNELFDTIRTWGQLIPITAVANSMAASAAYWIGSAADQFVVPPSGQVGSIGVWIAHQDFSEAEQMMGVKTTLIHAGKFKVERNPWKPLPAAAKADMQREVDEVHATFTKNVATGRKTTVADVKAHYGQGRLLRAPDALRVGMVDRIATLEETIREPAPRLAAANRALKRVSSQGAGRLRTAAAAIALEEICGD